jgi:CRP-like cAMP-binding protein
MPDEAFFVILAGKVGLVSAQSNRTIARLSEGDFVGEMVLLSGDPSLITATVEETATVLRIESPAINQFVNRLPRFALEISQFIDERRKLIRSAS